VTRAPAVAACRDKLGRPLIELAEESGNAEIVELVREASRSAAR
jgi:hypothetical protein